MRAALLCLMLAAVAQAVQFVPITPPAQVAHPAVSDIAVAGGVVCVASQTLACSNDGGATWTETVIDPDLGIRQIALDPSKTNVVYGLGAAGPLRSDDRGATWRVLNAGLPPGGLRDPRRLLIDPHVPSTLYLGAACTNPKVEEGAGFYRSTDGGNTWTRLLAGSSGSDCVDSLNIDPLSSELFYRDPFNGHHRSTDGGTTWVSSGGPLPTIGQAIDPGDPNLREGTTSFFSQGHTFSVFITSNDGGATWSTSESQALPFGLGILALDPATDRLFGVADEVYWSDDRGTTWQKSATGPRFVSNVVVRGAFVFASSLRGLYRAPHDQPSSWTLVPVAGTVALPVSVGSFANDPHDAATLYVLGMENAGFYTVSRPVMRSCTGGREWERLNGDEDLTERQQPVVDAAGDLFATSFDPTSSIYTLWRYSRNGSGWESWTTPSLGALVANPQHPGWLYAFDSFGASYSTDGGHTWTPMNGLAGATAMIAAPNGLDLYAGSYLDGGIRTSDDSGETWLKIVEEPYLTYHLAIAQSRPSTVYRITSQNNVEQPPTVLFRSDDSGRTWKRLQWPGESSCCPSPLAVDPHDWRSVWIGVLHSTDAGATWSSDANLPGAVAESIASDGSAMFAISNAMLWKGLLLTSHPRAARR
jgi:photosystem II stability/assembly factor-like uncharacterized protein